MYLISKILVCLTIAFAIGLALGWLLRRSIAIGNARSSDKHWSQRLRSAEQDREIAVAKLKSDVEEYRAQIPTLEQSLADRSDLIARLETENSELRDGAGPLRERLGAIEADAAKEAAAHEETRAAKAAVEAALEDSARRIEALEEEVAAAQDAQQRAVSLEALVARRDSERQQLSVENEKLVKRYAEAVEVSQEQVSRNHALQSASDALEARLAEQAEAIAQLEQQGARASVTADGLRAELDEAVRGAHDARERGEALAARIADLERELADAQRALDDSAAASSASAEQDRLQRHERLASLEAAAQNDRAVVTRLRSEADAWRDRCNALETESQQRARRIDAFATELGELQSRHAELGEALAERAQRVEELELALASRPASDAARPDWLLSASDVVERDDLKKIHGVGPVLERTLHDLGVLTYAQLARLEEADVEWLARQINTFPGRIRRDRWVEQARELHRSKYGRSAG